MRFLLDANLPNSAASLGEATGDDLVHVGDVGLGTAIDDDVLRFAIAEGRVLVTRDLDFADVRAYPPTSTAGIVVLRLPDDAGAREVIAVLRRLLAFRDVVAALPGRLAILDEDRIRMRPPLV